MAFETLFTPLQLGSLSIPNRVIMAPLTRSRTPDSVPGEMQEAYYGQRAGSGLIISEATNISPTARGYVYTPGIWTDAQEAGWKGVVNAVHAKGGRIALQLWHVGRVSHEMVQPDGQQPVAPSALKGEGAQCFVEFEDGTAGQHPTSTPRALETNEIPGIVADYRQAAERAKRAGFDMVEVHAANAYLLNQFLATGTNKRTDQYGGSLENRARFPLEVVDAVIDVYGADRVGIRMTPFIELFGLTDDEPEAMAFYMADQLSKRGLAYLHLNEPNWAGGDITFPAGFREQMRERFSGSLIYCGNYDAERADKRISENTTDAVAFGRPYIANPDLPERFRVNAPLTEPNHETFYGGDEKGYTDYPFMNNGYDRIQ
ncbi:MULTISPECIES: alkene reductase [Halomonadaceae]|jgi:N-ethylmaleimide reductase|uniref:alkene reductase n=1 Tax=Halomonadaceae TaxID=28256 RepID=UPI0012EF57C0|nr:MULTISPECIES: alkene reductase [Halomonas]CAD5259115.1 N-ethylmaleimide reductase, FMN-linked [Halomonas sp. 59]CAD5259397.1 N-ethylmaleimide reductase, FMN-linked [Halomonas sp. 113]CAD5273345.1 N-ethylmaleimide reductase, FMN-linked [Halomonas sp. I3]CAD5289328.1 N-ethylmaleimide reductase, FMN-linked [Halomonas sp. 156]VXB34194.1 N-ethylmaleimide reductase, FMN-linked [Halomonas titanicae]